MPTILIVDDRRDAIEVLDSKLQRKGFVTATTTDAQQIASICESQPIDLIVMDMNMPELDGCEATEMLRSAESTAKIPVIICTSQPLPGDAERAAQAGCNGFLEKPIHLGTLMKMMGQFFEVLDQDGDEEDAYEVAVPDSEKAAPVATQETQTPNVDGSETSVTRNQPPAPKMLNDSPTKVKQDVSTTG